jgi:hypothetical protein
MLYYDDTSLQIDKDRYIACECCLSSGMASQGLSHHVKIPAIILPKKKASLSQRKKLCNGEHNHNNNNINRNASLLPAK